MIKKLSRWECPACYICPALGKLPASLYVEMHSIRSTLSALTMRDSQNSMHLQNEISQLKDMMVTSNHESNLSSKIEMLQEEIRELKESAKGNSRAEMPSPVKAALETTTVTLPEAMTNIQASLSELSSKVLKIEASVQANEHPPQPNSDSPNSIKPNTSSPNLPKVETPCEPYESYETQVLSPELKNELLKFVEDHRSEFSSADETNSKRCVRLLFGAKPNFDRTEFFSTCARARTYADHMAVKNYCLENTKPIFNEEKIMSVYNLHVQHTFVELFKILKQHQPISLSHLFQLSHRPTSRVIIISQANTELTKHNFVHKASIIWNSLIDKVLDRCNPGVNNIVIPGSSKFSDLSSPVSVVKNRVKAILQETQNQKVPGREIEWLPQNHWGLSLC